MKAQFHRETSVAAATAIEPDAGTLRGRVLSYIRSVGGSTDEEIQVALGMNPSTARPRRVELVDKGLIFENGQRKTSSGRWAIVWSAVRREIQENLL